MLMLSRLKSDASHRRGNLGAEMVPGPGVPNMDIGTCRLQ